MEFCKECNFMLSIKTSSSDDLIYYCRHCGNTDEKKVFMVAYKKTFAKHKKDWRNYINEYTKLDPRLPRTYGEIKCPNTDCDLKLPNEIIHFRYDDENMKYFYLCINCDAAWTTDQ